MDYAQNCTVLFSTAKHAIIHTTEQYYKLQYSFTVGSNVLYSPLGTVVERFVQYVQYVVKRAYARASIPSNCNNENDPVVC